jgi:hypothetical protein
MSEKSAFRCLFRRSDSSILFLMNKDEHLQRHIELCRRVYLRMLSDDSWPWKEPPDSLKSEGVVESKDSANDL